MALVGASGLFAHARPAWQHDQSWHSILERPPCGLAQQSSAQPHLHHFPLFSCCWGCACCGECACLWGSSGHHHSTACVRGSASHALGPCHVGGCAIQPASTRLGTTSCHGITILCGTSSHHSTDNMWAPNTCQVWLPPSAPSPTGTPPCMSVFIFLSKFKINLQGFRTLTALPSPLEADSIIYLQVHIQVFISSAFSLISSNPQVLVHVIKSNKVSSS